MRNFRWQDFWPFLFYFSFYAALSVLMPYVALYYQGIGLTGAQVGLLTGLAPLITLVGAPIWTGIADATHRHKLVLNLSTLAAIVCAIFIPTLRVFAFLWGMVSLYTLVSSPIVPLADSATMSMLGDRHNSYSRLRIGGTIGWGIMSFFAGQILDRFGISWAYWLYAAMMLVNLLIAQGLQFGQKEVRYPFWNGIKTFIHDRRWVSFLIMAFVCGLGMASINIYQFVYMAQIGASKSLMGLSLTISTISELPVMLFGGWLLRKFKPRGLLTLSLVVIGVRLLLLSAFNYPLAILFIQLLHGLTFPAVWIAGVAYAYESAPPALAATGQGLFSAMLTGLGAAVGGFIGGLIIEAWGGRVMYLVFGAVILVSAIFFAISQKVMSSLASTRE